MVVPVETEDTFQHGSPQRLFAMDPYYEGPNLNWDISPDGQQFLMVKSEAPASSPRAFPAAPSPASESVSDKGRGQEKPEGFASGS